MSDLPCDPNSLVSFVNGELEADEEEVLTTHLDACPSCGIALEQLVADTDVWREAGELLGSNIPCVGRPGEEAPGTGQIDRVLDQLAPTDDPESLGRIGGYEVKGVIGAGGMGVVLKAHDRVLDRVVAIKVIAPHLACSVLARRRFAREAKAAAAVLHPNVIAIHGVCSEGDNPHLVMPFVHGASLQHRLENEGPLPLEEVLRVGTQIASGLAAAHGQGLVHRDIKPANIMLESGVERVSITDFGLARAVDDGTVTHSGTIAGTPQFMSPEQATGKTIDQRSDLFSLGSVLYAMCTGHAPFRAETSYGILRRITDHEPRDIREINRDVPDWLCALIAKLMKKHATDRFNSADKVAATLEECLAHVQHPTTVAIPRSVRELLPQRKHWQRRARLATGIAAAAMLLLIGVWLFSNPPGGNTRSESSELTTGNMLDGTWDIELHDPANARRSGFASFKAGVGMIATTNDQTEPMRFLYDIQPGKGRLLLNMHAATGADNGGKSTWKGIVELNGDTRILCFARKDQIDIHGRPRNCKNADPKIYCKVILKRQTSRALDVGTASRFGANNGKPARRKYQFTTESKVRILERSPDGQRIAMVMQPPDWVVRNDAWASWQPSVQIIDVKRLRQSGDALLFESGAAQRLHKHLFRSIHPVSQEYSLFRTEANYQLAIQSVSFSPSGRMLAVSTNAGHIVVVNADTGERIRSLDTREFRLDATEFSPRRDFPEGFIAPEVKSLAFSPDGTRLAVSGCALLEDSASISGEDLLNGFGALTLWDVNTGKQIRDLAGSSVRRYFPETVTFSPDGKTIASWGPHIEGGDAGESKAILMWDAESGQQTGLIKGFQGQVVQSMAFSHDGCFIAVNAGQTHAAGWNRSTTSLLSVDDDRLKWHHSHCKPDRIVAQHDVQFSDDGTTVYAMGLQGTIECIDVESGRVMNIRQPDDRTSWHCFATLPARAVAVGGEVDDGSTMGMIELFFDDKTEHPAPLYDKRGFIQRAQPNTLPTITPPMIDPTGRSGAPLKPAQRR